MAPRVSFVVVFLGVLALAACGGGGGTVPSGGGGGGGGGSTPTPSASPSPVPTSTASTTPAPSSSPAAAQFTGGSQKVSFTSAGGTFTIAPADGTYSASIAWGSNNASSSFNFTMSWATFGQITGTFSPGALPSSVGTAMLYLDFNSADASTVSFTQTPTITVNTTGSFPGTHCGFAFYGKISTATQWNSQTIFGIAEVTPSAGAFTIPAAALPTGNTADFKPSTDQYIALYCH